MLEPWIVAAGWYHAFLLAALPWVAAWRPHLAPLLVGLAVLAWPVVVKSRRSEPWASAVVVLSAMVYVISSAGWVVGLGWLVLAFVVGVIGWLVPRPAWGRPDAADFAIVLGWATALAARPQLVDLEHGGWLAPLLMMVAARRLSGSVVPARSPVCREPGPPTRDVRGTLSLRGVVAADPEGLVRTVPIDLEMRAGDSLAVLCDTGSDRRVLAEVLSGRRSPADGEVMVDGVPMGPADRLVAVVAPGERFVPGGVALNVGALSIDELDGGVLKAVSEACGLSEVADTLGDGSITVDGGPLDVYHRLLLLAARVIPSGYRMLVVVDPMPWVNAVRGEIWRSAVVRASVGRTSIWITGDRDLASRATQVMEFRQGALRPAD